MQDDGASSDKTVSLDKIVTTPMSAPPAGPTLSKNVDPFTGKGGTFDKELGWVGKVVGGNTEKSGNIAFIVIIVSFLFLIVVFWKAYDPAKGELSDGVWNMMTSLFSLVTGCVGFLFGNNKRKDD